MNRCRQPRAVTAEIDDALGVGGLEASDPDYVVVSTVEDLERVSADILGERDRPIVGLTLRLDGQEPVLRSTDIRVVVGAGIRIYLIAEADLLRGLRELLGSRLRLDGGAARIWWPGASARCDPADHPVVVALDGEDYPDTLAEFAQEFDLSRPHVRSRVRVIEDAGRSSSTRSHASRTTTAEPTSGSATHRSSPTGCERALKSPRRASRPLALARITTESQAPP